MEELKEALNLLNKITVTGIVNSKIVALVASHIENVIQKGDVKQDG